MSGVKESALVVLVPEAEPLVKPWRDKWDPSAAEGMPAHITIQYPFCPPHELTAASITALQDLFARFSGFAFSLAELQRFPTVLYLAPRPDAPFKELTSAVAEQIPERAPYGGAFADIVPHLTVAQVADQRQLDAIAVEVERMAAGQLPVQGSVAAVTLMESKQERWQVHTTFQLGRA